jgi:ribosomal protein S18 acetylase RimI-like enzyme
MYLTHLPPAPPANPRVKIERVHNVPNHTAFYTTLHAVFDFDLADVIKLFPILHLNRSYYPTIRHYLAFIDEQPAAAGTIICKDGGVSVYNLCTLDAYRRQGIATSLLYAMLQEAQRDEFNLAMVYATAQAYHLLTQFGFKIYTQRQWFLPPGLDYGDVESGD